MRFQSWSEGVEGKPGRRSPRGRSFHSRGPAAEKLLSPSLLCNVSAYRQLSASKAREIYDVAETIVVVETSLRKLHATLNSITLLCSLDSYVYSRKIIVPRSVYSRHVFFWGGVPPKPSPPPKKNLYNSIPPSKLLLNCVH